MVKNCQFLVLELQFDDLSISKLLEVDRLLSMFTGSMYRDYMNKREWR